MHQLIVMNKSILPFSKLLNGITFILLFILCFSIIGCGDDVLPDEQDPKEEQAVEIMIHHPSEYYTGDVSGRAVNQQDEALEAVKIELNGEQTTTDAYGFFSFKGMQLDAHGTLLTASKANYWTITKMLVPDKTQKNYTRFKLMQKEEAKSLEASAGGLVNFKEVVKIDFPENAFVNAQGASYTGEVNIFITHINPNDESFGDLSPGDFRAFNTESELQTLQSLGMAAVELRGTNNESLQLAEEVTATLYIRVPDGNPVDEVPLWHFDEESGYWLEEGLAQREGDFYVGEVNHFSWWNCDIPFTAVKLSGTVVNADGTGISGLPITVFLADGMQNLGVDYTGDRGLFCGWIPKDQSLIIQIKNECGTIFYEETIGPFSEDENLGTIVATSQNVIEVCGSLINCDMEAVSNGYLLVEYGANQAFIPVDAAGNFCGSVLLCESTSFELIGLDISSGLQGFPVSYDLDNSPLQDLELNTCDELASVFKYQIDNEDEVIITDFTINKVTEYVIGFGSVGEHHGIFPKTILDGQNWGTPDFLLSYYSVDLASSISEVDCDAFTCGDITLEVNEYTGVGHPINLKITGTTDSGQSYVIHVSGELME